MTFGCKFKKFNRCLLSGKLSVRSARKFETCNGFIRTVITISGGLAGPVSALAASNFRIIVCEPGEGQRISAALHRSIHHHWTKSSYVGSVLNVVHRLVVVPADVTLRHRTVSVWWRQSWQAWLNDDAINITINIKTRCVTWLKYGQFFPVDISKSGPIFPILPSETGPIFTGLPSDVVARVRSDWSLIIKKVKYRGRGS